MDKTEILTEQRALLNKPIDEVNRLLAKVDGMPETVADGKTPVFETGNTVTLSAGSAATSEVVRDGSDGSGNPKYKFNFGIPRGRDGSGGGTGGGIEDAPMDGNIYGRRNGEWSEIKQEVSDENICYIPGGVYGLREDSTKDSVVGALGGIAGLRRIWEECMVNGKSAILRKRIGADDSSGTPFQIPVTVEGVRLSYRISLIFEFTSNGLGKIIHVIYEDNNDKVVSASVDVKDSEFHHLSYRFYSLTSESDSEAVSDAVGGETGLNALVEAVRKGKKVYITGGENTGAMSTPLAVTVVKEDLGVTAVFSGMSYMIWSTSTSAAVAILTFDKQSGTFSFNVSPINLSLPEGLR